MSPKYTISVECVFSASHTLSRCPPCDRLHGHTWRVKSEWVFDRLDESGMGANFSRLQAVLDEKILRSFDHRHLNEIVPFDSVEPTAENLAREFYRILLEESKQMPSGRLSRVTVWEGAKNSVAYEE